MQIIISAKNFRLTTALEDYVNEKFSKLEHFWNRIIKAIVELESDETKKATDRFMVAVTLEVPGPDIGASVRSEDMYAAIDEVVPKLERRLNKIKGKFLNKRKNFR